MPIYGDDWLSLLLTCTPTLGIICYSALTVVITNLEHRFKHQSNYYFQSTLYNLKLYFELQCPGYFKDYNDV